MYSETTAACRARLLATVRLQYPDGCADRGYELLHPATGEAYTGERRHLVATCRGISNFALGTLVGGPDWCRDAAAHGLRFLRDAHRVDDDGYRLVVTADGEPVDRTRSAYGHAFVLLAYARAKAVGLDGASTGLEAAADLLERRFVDETGLVRSDCDPDWTEREPYRGANANMHACEAFLAAYEATDDGAHLDRARRIAHRFAVELAAETDGLLWEHYDADWTHDFGYNADEPDHQFRPPGYQPGHHAEWAKLLALLDRYDDSGAAGFGGSGTGRSDGNGDERPANGWYDRAAELFDAAVDLGWTGDGFVYTVGRDGDALVPDRYGWAVAEAVGAAAALAERARATDDAVAAEHFGAWHDRLVDCAGGFRGPAGTWYEKRTDGGEPVAPDPPGVEPDYHPIGAWYESWRSFADGGSGERA